jgi:hypothetical protein
LEAALLQLMEVSRPEKGVAQVATPEEASYATRNAVEVESDKQPHTMTSVPPGGADMAVMEDNT